ncbi:hypothetical protein FRC19_011016 [Serendipita sp. 401]|nr:hypothetical protein FRC16_003160 [Serendipita sp. 398]KAG8817902.1 hypothetical protein FRC19_011016 [Serendipita sp. 401]KAG8845129.1 hypothetical protein FRC20_003299 [Serendipita sp. 405]KAG9052267.1 hypothetical protein FS842_010228 [Serendipita sp. 407]
MRIITAITALVFAAITVLASPVELEERQGSGGGDGGPPGFNITSIGVNGSGCPAGTVFYLLNEQRTAVTLTFSNYYASAGPGITIEQNRKNCVVTLGLDIPRCWNFAIVEVDYYGYYQLDKKVKAIQSACYHFLGGPQGCASSTFPRPSDPPGPVPGKTYTITDLVAAGPSSVCCRKDTILNINSAIRVDNSDNKAGSGYISTDILDFQTIYHFKWWKCCEGTVFCH